LLLRKYIVWQARSKGLLQVGETLPLWIEVPSFLVWDNWNDWDIPREWQGFEYLKNEIDTYDYLSQYKLNWFYPCPPKLLIRLRTQDLRNVRPRSDEESLWLTNLQNAILELGHSIQDFECFACLKKFM
jgi:hypothetical protein